MKAKQIIDAAKLNLNITEDSWDELLLFYLKNVLNEVATEFIPVYSEQKCNAVNGEIELTSLEKVPIKITSVKNKDENLRFFESPFKLLLKPRFDGEVTVTYSFLPLVSSPEDELPYGEALVRALSFGLCAEYCLVSGLDADAQLWDVRYKDAVKEAAFARGNHMIKPRAWY